MDSKKAAPASQWRTNHATAKALDDRLDERNSRILLYGYSSDEEGSEVDHSTSSSPVSRQKTAQSTTTASSSDLSLTTPGIMPSPPLLSKESDASSSAVGVQTRLPPAPRPVLRPSLSSPADSVDHRFAAAPRPARQKPAPLDDAYDECISPIEVATPVSYSKPSMISVYHIPVKSGPRASLSQSTTSSTRRTSSLPSKSTRRLSNVSDSSGYPACEATPVEIPALPANALMMISNASRESLGIMRPSEKDGKLSKKPSMPLLSRALKFAHPRVSGKASSTDAVPQLRYVELPKQPSRPATGVAKPTHGNAHGHSPATAPEANPVQPVPLRRPDFSEIHRPSASITALPPLPDFPLPPIQASQPLQHARRKSFSNLRSRSGSIGQALKSRISIRIDPAVPAVPVLVPSDPKASLDLGRFPAPPAAATTVPLPKNSVTSFSRPNRH